MKLDYQSLDVEVLLLDPNNYRFLDDNPTPPVANRRFGEASVQESALKRLRTDSTLQQLKDSIIANGFLPSEPLVVRVYDEDRYLVVDGNRRTAAVKSIIKEFDDGSSYDKISVDRLRSLPAVIVEDSDSESSYQVLMGVRHLSGVKKWGGYAEAKLINDLAVENNMTVATLAERIGLDVAEINRRRRAFRATEQFRMHDEFRKSFKTDMYALFHEAVAIPAIRNRYKWDNEEMKFVDPLLASDFFSLLVPTREDDREFDAKLRTFNDVRKFGRQIVPHDELVARLQQRDETLDGIIANLDRDREDREWSSKIAKLVTQLQKVPALSLAKATTSERAILNEAKTAIETLIKHADGNQ